MILELIAKVSNEAVRAYNESIGGNMYAWDDMCAGDRMRALSDVEFYAADKTRKPCDLHLKNIEGFIRLGWSHGVEFDAIAKKSPNICNYSDLPIEMRTRFEIVHAVVRAFGL